MNSVLNVIVWPFKQVGLLISSIWNTLIYKPLLNLLVFLTFLIPGNHLWFSVLILTLIIKFLMAPFSYKALVSQVKNKKIQPLIEKIKQENPDNKQLQAQKQLEIYQKIKVNPLSGCLPTLVNLAVIWGLFRLFRATNIFDGNLVYPFIKIPETINNSFLGISDITLAHGFSELTAPVFVFALIAGVTQHVQVRLSPAFNQNKEEVENTNPVAMAQGQMKFMMLYALPVLIVWFGISLPPALTFYWIINNLFTIGQEFVVRKKLIKVELEIEQKIKEIVI